MLDAHYSHLDKLFRLVDIARRNNIRFMISPSLSFPQQQQLVVHFFAQYSPQHWIQMGGEQSIVDDIKWINYKQGNQLLGQDHCGIIYDCSTGFDANSFSAAIGTVSGGGFVFLLHDECIPEHSQQWLKYYRQHMGVFDPVTDDVSELSSHYQKHDQGNKTKYSYMTYQQQEQAVERIVQLATMSTGIELLSAHRGRGKTRALGIASKQLLKTMEIDIVVVAPKASAIQPLLDEINTLTTSHKKHTYCYQQSRLRFLPPDVVVEGVSCDLLLVDEAAAIPLPLLKKMAAHYKRIVYSSTIHGYEGSGRGFSLKFLPWLQQQRLVHHHFHLTEPIRWATDDPLEHWSFEAFLLNCELDKMSIAKPIEQLTFRRIDSDELVARPELAKRIFSLLIHAHYQTKPNDFFSLLDDPNITLYAGFHNGTPLVAVLTVQEGQLASDVVAQVELGQRRPKGHLVPVMLANHCAAPEAAYQKSVRIMRIAVHPNCQTQGVGKAMLNWLEGNIDCDYFSVSYGVTVDLLTFWLSANYQIVRLGEKRDKASGTHSIIMVKAHDAQILNWLVPAQAVFTQSLPYYFKELLLDLDFELQCVIQVAMAEFSDATLIDDDYFNRIISNYINGGNSYFSSFYAVRQRLLSHKQAPTPLIEKWIELKSWSNILKSNQKLTKKQQEQLLKLTLSQWLQPIE